MKKISLKNFENCLSRNEMKTIFAGKRIEITPECTEDCSSNDFCSGNSSCPNCSGGKCSA
jgi:hypothetical protein